MVKPGWKVFLVVFVGRGMVMGIFFGSVPFTSFNMYAKCLSLLSSCPWIVLSGLGVYFGMVGCLVLMVCLVTKPWDLSFGELASFHLERCLGPYPAYFSAAWTPPDYWDADDIALEMPEHPNVWTDGSREDFFSIVGFEVAGAGAYLPAAEVAFDHSASGTVEEYGDARLERCRAFSLSLGFCRRCSVLSFGVLLLLCKLIGIVILVLIILMSFVALVLCLMLTVWLNLFPW